MISDTIGVSDKKNAQIERLRHTKIKKTLRVDFLVVKRYLIMLGGGEMFMLRLTIIQLKWKQLPFTILPK